jgi:DNA helicase HerA-like ATPase
MLTLLKQARAFGLGVVLATQNPVDLDYKGLSNCGTWLLGRLQTERTSCACWRLRWLQQPGGLRSPRMEGIGQPAVADLLLPSVHEGEPVVFHGLGHELPRGWWARR